MKRSEYERYRREVLADAAAGVADTPPVLTRELAFPDPVRALLRCDCGALVVEGEDHDCDDTVQSEEPAR